jgi:hypothetical protein
MRLEGKSGSRHAKAGGTRLRGANHRPVAAVHAIEIANRHHGAPQGGGRLSRPILIYVAVRDDKWLRRLFFMIHDFGKSVREPDRAVTGAIKSTAPLSLE